MGDFAFDSHEATSFHLTNTKLEVAPGTLVMVVGATGSGKSALLDAVVGTMPRLSGISGYEGTLAYATQSSFIVNGTIKDNVLFGRPFVEGPYRVRLVGSSRCCRVPTFQRGIFRGLYF